MPTPKTAPINPYLRTKALTATPGELRLMLYDGAMKFCRQARTALVAAKHEESYHNLTKAQNILMELMNSLEQSVDPDLCDKLSALYNYAYRCLLTAGAERDAAPLDEAIALIDYQRQTWRMLLARSAEETGQTTGTSPASAPSFSSSPSVAAATYSQSA